MLGIRVQLDDERAKLYAFNYNWLSRVAMTFGREQQRYLMERVAVSKKLDPFDLFWDAVRGWIEQRALDLTQRIVTSMLEAARDVLRDGVNFGWGSRKIARELTNAVGGTRADNERIARTEVHNAAGQAAHVSATVSGLEVVKEWASTDDARTRDSHREANGQRREMDQPFDVGDDKLAFPGDPSGSPEEVINCRCVALYHPRINGVVYD